jgi:hypothetical protein
MPSEGLGFCKKSECRGFDVNSSLRDPTVARATLRSFKSDGSAMLALRRLVAREGAVNTFSMSDDAVIEFVAHLLMQGEVHVHTQGGGSFARSEPNASEFTGGRPVGRFAAGVSGAGDAPTTTPPPARASSTGSAPASAAPPGDSYLPTQRGPDGSSGCPGLRRERRQAILPRMREKSQKPAVAAEDA